MPFSETSVIEITVFGRSDSGQQVLNVFHYRQQSTVPQAYTLTHLEEAVGDFAAIWRSNILPVVSAHYKVEKWRGRALTGTIANPTPPPPNQLVVGEQFELNGVGTDVGGRGGVELVTFDALGMQKLSSRAGRNFRGSARFGTLADADVTANGYEAAYFTIADANLALFVAATLSLVFDAIIWELAIFSRTLALAAPPPFTDLRSLTSIVVGRVTNAFVTSQVSRKQSLTQPT